MKKHQMHHRIYSIYLWNFMAFMSSMASNEIGIEHTTKSESLILMYDGYYKWEERKSILFEFDEIKNSINIEVRPNLLSDFDVIEVPLCNKSWVIENLKSSAHIRIVTTNSRFSASSPFRKTLARDNSGYTEICHVAKLLNVNKLWDMGFKGQGVKVAVFDTGLAKNHPHFKQILELTDWTNEKTTDDGLGHGTFVAGVIGGSDQKCPGLAPAASIYIYKVFTKKQVSFTSWFLDAFNFAIFREINILNLSIGGPDFTDIPFMDKVWELTANNIILISAIGNDGPNFGTLNNPADQMDVIGVGGINSEMKVARFSSRGMTTWELPDGYGRIKPDIVTYGTSVYGSSLDGDCRTLSGTSVASPVVAGAVAMMLSGIEDRNLWNPGVVKQALVQGAIRLQNHYTMFEQGSGRMDVIASFNFMRNYEPMIMLMPPYIDFNECPYMWPYCSQPIYYSGIPIIINVTVISGLDVSSRIFKPPRWEPFADENGTLLSISITYSEFLWPWSGYMAIRISVKEEGKSYDGIVTGRVILVAVGGTYGIRTYSRVEFPIRVRIIPTPSRRERVLWDQFRNLRYPPGYLPRDDLRDRANPLDWTGDHPHTTFKHLYQNLRSSGHYIEVLGEPVTCVDLNNYNAYVLVDPEDEFFPEEIEHLYKHVELGLNLIIFADWYNSSVAQKIRFMDENTKQWWEPETGGSNLPAVNNLIAKWNFTFGSRVLEGTVPYGRFSINYASGTSIIRAPQKSYLAFVNLTDLGEEMLSGKRSTSTQLKMAVFGFYRDFSKPGSGFISLFGDSTCLEIASRMDQKGCIRLLENLLSNQDIRLIMKMMRQPSIMVNVNLDHLFKDIDIPERLHSNFHKYSKVIDDFSAGESIVYRKLLKCKNFSSSVPHAVLNMTLPVHLLVEVSRLRHDASSVQGESIGLSSVQIDILDQILKIDSVEESLHENEFDSETIHQNWYLHLLIYLTILFIFLIYYKFSSRRLFLLWPFRRRLPRALFCF